jgi:hypothetical protein
MSYRFWPILVPAVLVASACGGSAPLAPSRSAAAAASPATTSINGATVNAIDGTPIPSINVKIGDRTVTSDGGGAFHLENPGDGSLPVVLTGPSVVERRLVIASPSAAPLRASLIPTAFDLAAFDQMFRGTGQMQRWTAAPSLVVLTTVMTFEAGSGDQNDYPATSEQLTDAETTLLIGQLTEALATLTGNSFTAFASVERESAAPGARVNTQRAGKIVVGRYAGLQTAGNTIGTGRWATDGHGRVTGGAVLLDRDFDKASDMRRLLRTHELGHALGYQHVTIRSSIMNPAIGPDVTTFDRDGTVVAFQRKPGNQSPDVDPAGELVTHSAGASVSIVPGTLRTEWAAPIVCGPMLRGERAPN